MRKRARAGEGFTLIEILITVGVIGLLASLAAFSVLRSRDRAALTICASNLEQIARAKAIWSLDHPSESTTVPDKSELFGGNNYLKKEPHCPMGGRYEIEAVNTPPTCTIAGHALNN